MSQEDWVIYHKRLKKNKILDCHPEFIERSVYKNSVLRSSTTLPSSTNFDVADSMTQAVIKLYSIAWDSRDQNNKPVFGGIYFTRLTAGELEITRKMLLMK